MSPRRPCGRPRRPWAHRQKRQLVRLYTLTTLSNAEILAVLEGEGFQPSERHVQMKLRSLYSKRSIKDLHELRPRSDAIMRSRLNALSQFRGGRISKTPRHNRIQVRSNTVSPRPTSATANCEDVFRAFRSYYEPITEELENHLSDYDLPGSQPTRSGMLMLDGSSVSNEITAVPPETHLSGQNCPFCQQSAYKYPIEPILQLNCGDICHEQCLAYLLEYPHSLAPRTCPNCSASLRLDTKSGIDPGKLETASKRKRDHVRSSSFPNVLQKRGPEEQEEGVEANSSSNLIDMTEQQDSDNEVGNLTKRLRNRSPSYIEHVASVLRLSLSDSYRSGSSLRRVASSLGRTASSRSSWMSMSSRGSKLLAAESSHIPSLSSKERASQRSPLRSGRMIFYRAAAPLLKGEREIWNEIIDESQLLPAPDSRPAKPERGIFDRLCSGKLDSFDKSCNHCGYAIGWYHWQPGTGCDYHGVDSLGNTKLHYAAVSGVATLLSICSLIDNGVEVGARNISGDTFLHVFKTKEFIRTQGIPDYITLLKLLSQHHFPFSQRDFDGRTIGHILSRDGQLSCFEEIQFRKHRILNVLAILNIDIDALDNHGFNAADEILRSAEIYARRHKPDAALVNGVKESLALYRNPSRLKVYFREEVAKKSWKASLWLGWLEEQNLLTWIDTHGDTPLTALLKNRRSDFEQPALCAIIPELVKFGVDVNMRDRKGHTALAIAAIRGSISCVRTLLASGASVDSENYHGKSIISMASWRMRMAEHEGKSECYSRILACVNLLAERRI